jgi:hypothetical protein
MASLSQPAEQGRTVRFSGLQGVVCFCIAALIDAAFGLYQLKALLQGSLPNPDSYM